MKCERTEELLSPYLEDELIPEEKRRIEEHLKTCSNCKSLLSHMKETTESLADFPEREVSADLWSRLYDIPRPKKRFKLSLDFLVRPSYQPVMAAATIVLTLMSFYMFHPNKSRIDKSIDRQIHLGYSKAGKLYAKAESFADSMLGYKDNILVSLKNTKLLGGTEE